MLPSIIAITSFIGKIFSSLWRPLRDLFVGISGRALVIEHEYLPDRDVWAVGLRYPLTDRHLEAVPSADWTVQNEWLINDMHGIMLGDRIDRFSLYNNSQATLHIIDIRVKIERRVVEKFPTVVYSADQGLDEEDFLGANLADGFDHSIRKVSIGLKGYEWSDTPERKALRRLVLSGREDFSFQLLTDTGDDSVSWRLEVEYARRLANGKLSRRRILNVPNIPHGPLLTARQPEYEGQELWYTGVNCLQGSDGKPIRPYFKKAKPRRGRAPIAG